ncbi:hypothetical protein FOA52_003060 [Chlamydomonas sp. UWO 241]|nr:hypothetical protein FOA52_003060 [Chlamydomonas sp. UWO 241]
MTSAVELIDAAIAQLDKLLAAAPAKQPTAVPESISTPTAAPAAAPAAAPPPAPKAAKQPKEPKPAAAAAPPAASGTAEEQLFAKALLVVAKVASVEEVENSDKLFKLTVDVGGGEIKHVCAGLKQFITADALLGSLVTVVLNLKAARLAGNLSEAMILAADTPGPGDTTIVRTLAPPPGASPGDAVYLDGGEPSTGQPKTLKSDDWKKIVAALLVKGSKATYAGAPMVTAGGAITLPSDIPDGAGIH